MSDENRFEPISDPDSRRGVAVVEGRDRRTGLAVRIFRFAGPPRGAPDRIDHPNLPGVMALTPTEAGTELVQLAIGGYVPLAAATLDPEQVQAFSDALAALHAAGIVHGGLGPERLRVSSTDDHVLIEGGGAAWMRPDGREPSERDDVRALASMLLAKTDGLVAGQRRVLEDAAEGTGPDDGVALSVQLSIAAHEGAAAASADRGDGAAEGGTAGGGTFVKDLPPGGVYSSGETRPPELKPPHVLRPGPTPPPSPSWRVPRPALLLAIAAVITIWLAYALRPEIAAPPTPVTDPSLIIVVDVAPANVPPLDIVVVDAPLGSSLEPGSGLGRAPRRVQLDARGRWIIEGRFGDRSTEPVELLVPGTSVATLTLPPLDDGTAAAPSGDGAEGAPGSATDATP